MMKKTLFASLFVFTTCFISCIKANNPAEMGPETSSSALLNSSSSNENGLITRKAHNKALPLYQNSALYFGFPKYVETTRFFNVSASLNECLNSKLKWNNKILESYDSRGALLTYKTFNSDSIEMYSNTISWKGNQPISMLETGRSFSYPGGPGLKKTIFTWLNDSTMQNSDQELFSFTDSGYSIRTKDQYIKTFDFTHNLLAENFYDTLGNIDTTEWQIKQSYNYDSQARLISMEGWYGTGCTNYKIAKNCTQVKTVYTEFDSKGNYSIVDETVSNLDSLGQIKTIHSFDLINIHYW